MSKRFKTNLKFLIYSLKILTIQFISVNVLLVILQVLLQIVTLLKDENPLPFIFKLRPPPVLPKFYNKINQIIIK
jgi:hypothetical protein